MGRGEREKVMADLRGVIFDIDGTLLLSNDAHAHAWADALSALGWEVPFFRIKWLIGMGGDKLLATLFPGVSSEEGIGKVMSERRKRIFLTRYAPHLEAAPGSRDLVARVKNAGRNVVIATSAKSDELDTLLKKAWVEDLFEQVTTSSDVEESKPAPDAVEAALDKLQLPAENVLMVGDTPYDIESARKAGVRTVAVRTGGWDDDALAGALSIYDSPADIVAHFDQSPFGGHTPG